MKTWYLLPFVMVLGVMVGRWLPQNELRTSKPPPKPAEQPAPRNDAFNSLTRMVQIPDRAKPPPRDRARPPSPAPTLEEGEGGEGESLSAPREETFRERRRRERREWMEREEFAPEDLRARIDEARDLWATRVAIARDLAVEKLNLTEAGGEVFDGVISQMNESFVSTVQALANELKAGGEMTPELGARVVSALSATMVETYNGLAEALPPEKHGDVSKMELTDFIDPAVIEPLIDVQDKLQGFGGRR